MAILIRSLMDFAPTEGCAMNAIGMVAMPLTGTKSFCA